MTVLRLSERLVFRISNHWEPLPLWASSLVDLGDEIGSASRKLPLTLALAVPTRSFAAAMLVSGIISGRASREPVDRGRSQHFEMLCTLPEGTAVTFADGNILRPGILAGVRDLQGRKRVRVQLQQRVVGRHSQRARWVDEEGAIGIQVARNPDQLLPKGAGRGKRIIHSSAFLEAALPDYDTDRFVLETSLECVVVGQRKALTAELENNSFAISVDGAVSLMGSLQDICRFRRLLSRTEAYRCEIVPSQTKKAVSPSAINNSTVVVFDGALAYIRWRHLWADTDQIVLLDSTESQFEDAALAFNEEFIQTRADSECPFDIPQMAAGVETGLFERSPNGIY